MPSEDVDDEGYARFVAERRELILGRIAAAATRAGRDPAEVTLEAVSKTVDVPQVVHAIHAGYRVFGENRPQELSRKLEGLGRLGLADEVRFDMIGNLQTNKINQVLGHVGLIHSISSPHLAEAVSKRALVRGESERVLLEVNVSGEESKSGMSASQLLQSFDQVLSLEGIEVEGLMTMAPAHDPDSARRTFSGLRQLAERLRTSSGLALPVLSCGMSDDFEIAVEQGSTLVRLGRIAFSPAYVMGE
jgi:pyridoxal phosphate enzyme (YggS family)